MEEIFEIRSCVEILANNIKIYTTDQYIVRKLYIPILHDQNSYQ